MIPVDRPVDEGDLHAQVDGLLPPHRAAAVDEYLAENPDAQARFSQYAEQRQALRAALATQAGPIPDRLRVARIRAERRHRRYRQLAQIAAAVSLLVLGGVAGWAVRDVTGPILASASGTAAGIITADAIAAHRIFSVEVRHPVEVNADQEAHLVQWLSKRLGRDLIVPDLASAGFKLMGGRLLPAEDGPAAQFMYENGSGERLTLYLRVGVGGGTAFRYHEEGGIGAFYWSDEGFGYAIAAKADRNLLLRIAELVYRQTSPDGAKAKIPPPPGKSS
ncbi:MAG: anti-sigma factor [Acetobacteraceae bacterium]|nr:anti-sigma factor [Acetobacteraceae bacterium]